MTLAALQRKFHATVTGIDDTGVLDWPADMRDGLAVYRTAYRGRLLDCLRGAFDKCRKWIGDEGFDAAAAHHLILHPPASWTLDEIGRGFSETLSALFPEDREVEELAWLEWELQQVFVSEDVPALAATDFAGRASAFAEDDWLDLRLAFVSSLRTRGVVSDCAALWTAIDEQSDMPALELPDGAAMLVVWRQDLRARFRMIGEDEAAGLALMRGGGAFEQLCAALVRARGEAGRVAAAGTMLGQWVADGLVTDISVEPAQAKI